MTKYEDELITRRVKQWSNLSYKDLAELMIELREEYDKLKKEAAFVWVQLEAISRQIIPSKMDAEGIANITIELNDGSRRRIQLNDQISVKTPLEKKPELWNWLREHDAEDLISETVNSSTLAAFVREQMRNGGEVPNEICEINAYTVASLNKA